MNVLCPVYRQRIFYHTSVGMANLLALNIGSRKLLMTLLPWADLHHGKTVKVGKKTWWHWHDDICIF